MSNGKTLVVVESPAKAKTIEKYLGGDYAVRASYGHIRDLGKGYGGLGVDVEHAFTPNLTIRAEYRFTDFGEASGRLLPLMPAFRMPVDLETQTVRLGASYKW